MAVTEPSLGATGWNTWGHDVTTIVNAVETAPDRLDALESGVAAGVNTVTAANATITVAGTGTNPTVAVGTIVESQVTSLVADLAAKAAKASNLSDLTDASAARTNLGLAPIAASGSATNLSTGTVPTARLGSGTANATKFLRGDQTWAAATDVASGFVTPMQFGAVGNGSTDDSIATQAAFDSGLPVLIDRTYLVGSLTAATGLAVHGTPGGRLLRAASASYTISINAGSGGSSDPSTNIARVQFVGVAFDDNVAVNTFRQGDAQLNLNACSDVLVSGCTFLGFRSDAIYLGSSNTGATERHNQRVKIVNNTFDGVNKDNRNAISVIDCDDLLIAGNSFRRCTRADMPGPIDIEPNSGNAFPILRNFKIVNNTFESVGGSACIGTLLAAMSTFTTAPRNWRIEGNTFRSLDSTVLPINFLAAGNATSSSARQDINVVGNVCESTRRMCAIDGFRGVRFIGNNAAGTTLAAVQLGSSYAVYEAVFTGNEFYQAASTDTGSPAAISVVNATYVKIDANTFTDCGLSDNSWGLCVILAGSGSSSNFVDFVGTNTMRAGTRMTDVSYKSSGHTKGANNTYTAPIGATGSTVLP